MGAGTARSKGIWGSSILVIFLVLVFTGNAGAGSISVSMTDSISNTGSGGSGDYSATHNIYGTGSDLTFGIRNNTDSTYFGYRIVGQASADSTFLSGSDTANVSGIANFGFTLPTGSTNAALWNISVDVIYRGVAASDGSSSTALAGNLYLNSTGVASGIADTLYGSGTTTNGTNYVSDTGTLTKNNVLPGTGSVSLDLYLGASSGGIGDEALAAIGQTSPLGFFSLNSLVDTTNDGAYITVTLTPHLNFSGQTLNSSLSLNSGENLNGYGTVNGDVTGIPGSSINPTGTLILGNLSSSNGFNFSGTLNAANRNVYLYDSNYADLYGTASLSGGSITTVNGLRLAGTSSLSGYGTVNGPIQGSATSVITASGSGLTLGSTTSSSGFNFGGMLNVGGSTVTLNDSNYAELGGTANLDGGSIYAANGLRLTGTGSLSGYGTVNGLISGDAGSTISATGGSLFLGSLSSTSGFNFGGMLNVGGSTVTLNDSNYAELGGTANLGGGSIYATNGLYLTGTGSLSGNGAVFGSILGYAGSTITSVGSGSVGLVLGNGGSTSGFNFGGTLNVGGSTVTLNDSNYAELGGIASLNGGTINAANGLQLTGMGILSGYGTVNGPIQGSTTSVITASGSGLTLGSTTSSSGFNFGGTLNVGSSSVVTLLDSNYAELGGTANLDGGSIYAANGLRLNDTGRLQGYGTIQTFAPGLNNYGEINLLSGGTTTVDGNVTNKAGANVSVANATAVFNGDVTNDSGATITVTGSSVEFNGTLTNNGAYISDPSTNEFTNLTVGSTGYLQGQAGDRFVLSNDFINQSNQNTQWDTVAAFLAFVTGTDEAHDLYLPGVDLGGSITGYKNNFAWGALYIEEGQNLHLFDGNTSDTGGALYVGELLGAVLSGSDVTNIFQGGATALNIYYNPSLAGNSYLGGLQYALAGGGLLSPVPIPSTVILFASGLLGLVGLGRRRLKA